MRFVWTILLLIAFTGSAFAVPSVIPVLTNPGWELSNTNGWGWNSMNGCVAGYTFDSTNPHTGKQCIVFKSDTPAAPNVYCRLNTWIGVEPETEYELVMWVRGEDVQGPDGFSNFTDWSTFWINFPTGTYDWQKITQRFKTKPGQFVINTGFNISNKCKALAIDDMSLKIVGTPLNGEGIEASFSALPKVYGHKAPAYLVVFANSSLKDAVKFEAVVTAGSKILSKKSGMIKPGESAVEWEWNSLEVPFGKIDCSVRIMDSKGKVIASANREVEKVDSPLAADIYKTEQRMKEFNRLYKQCRQRNIPLDYPTATKTMLDQFFKLSYLDAQKGQDWRVKYAAVDFNRSIDKAVATMKAYIADPNLAPNVKRYKTGKVEVKGLSFVGDRVDSKGNKDRGPLFFIGYGHFLTARTDIPKWPGYGVNIIQGEFGPAQVLTSETDVDLTAAKDFLKVLDNAAKHNVKVDFLISPHYFPAWALKKWPELLKGGGGWLGYNVDAPEAKQVLERYLRIVVPMFKDKPALNSFCLSNEPTLWNQAGSPNTRPMWNEYLTKIHGDINTLNSRYGKDYKSFDDVPTGGTFGDPQFYNWCVFNNERFAAWHRWMADVIHSMAPNIPVHTKVMSTELNRDFTAAGCDHELLGQLLDLNGNDCYVVGDPGPGMSVSWQFQNMSYDMQRSFARKPIINSENHLTIDKVTSYVPPEHFQYALWQGAVHGQGATTIWVWEHTFDRNFDLYANVMDRPGCAEATGMTCLDLNMFADEVTALQNAKAPVAVMYSTASMIHSKNHSGYTWTAYASLNFCGVKIDFITEKQLASGKGKEYKMIVLPEVTHVPQAVFDAIKNLPESTKVVMLNDCLQKDPYNKDFSAEDIKAIKDRALSVSGSNDIKTVIWPAFAKELAERKGLPEESVVDAVTGKPIYGVEWLPVKINGRTIINIVNVTSKQQDVKIMYKGKEMHAKNLLSLGGRESVRILKPMVPVLAEVKL